MSNIDKNAIEAFVKVIENRNNRRNLNVSYDKLNYAISYIFDVTGKDHFENVLIIGVGHGLDAISMLLSGKIEKIIGVDPYINSDGNDNKDFDELMKLNSLLGIEDKFQVRKMTIQEYLETEIDDDKFDLIIANDVLHHIYVTTKHLSRSVYFNAAAALFKELADICSDNGYLCISDVSRSGLIPTLKKVGIIGGSVNFGTKQPWNEWDKAVSLYKLWKLIRMHYYTPYALRGYRSILKGVLGKITIGYRYYLCYNKICLSLDESIS